MAEKEQNQSDLGSSISGRLAQILQEIQSAAVKAGREAEKIRLVGVTKTVPWQRVEQGIQAGLTVCGENYVQEALGKAAHLSPVELHLIGNLQRNKAKDAVKIFSMVQTVDRPELADVLDRCCQGRAKKLDVLIQVNTSGEQTKSGVLPEATTSLAKFILAKKELSLRGFMCIGRFLDENASESERRSDFRLLRELSLSVGKEVGVVFSELSMGMSHDFALAIEEGATLVRIGTRLFGQR